MAINHEQLFENEIIKVNKFKFQSFILISHGPMPDNHMWSTAAILDSYGIHTGTTTEVLLDCTGLWSKAVVPFCPGLISEFCMPLFR